MKRSYFSIFSVFLFFSFHSAAQIKQELGYFSFPMSIKPKLNANFGEMRPNHFHMGLDLSTESRENLPIYAPADGYIARIKIEQGGFGRALYLNHPNGLTTLFAHMNRFIPAAEQYLRLKQYEQENWKIDLNIPDVILPVKKGQLIGYSGNTGASQGPHVHFEIRDTQTEDCYNPLRLQFPIHDQIPPLLYKLVFYDRDKSIYEQSPLSIPLKKIGNTYKPMGVISLPFSKAFIGIQAIDRITGAPNQYGIFKAELYDDQQLLTSFTLDSIGYDKTRYQNGHIDYLSRSKGGGFYQMLFPPTEFGAGIYSPVGAKKWIDLLSTPSTYTLNVYDAFDNFSIASFEIQSVDKKAPELVRDGSKMTPGIINIFENELVRFVFKEDAFYDAFHFSYNAYYPVEKDAVSSVVQTLPEYIPVQSYFSISIKPNRDMALLNSDRIVMERKYRGKIEVKKASKERGLFSAQFRDFGHFKLLEDLQPPVIVANVFSGKLVNGSTRIVIDVSDNNRVIKDFRAMIDGQWVMFLPTGNRFSYYPDEHFPAGEHKLSVVVYDEAGNMASKEWNLKR
jgi:hypothetical protein